MKLTVRNLKETHTGLEHDAFSATVYVDGVRAFTVWYDGDGGTFRYGIIGDKSEMLLQRARAHAMTLPPVIFQTLELLCDLDMWIAQTIDQQEQEKLYKKALRKECQQYTLFRTPDDMPESWHFLKVPFSKTVEAAILEQFPDAEIANLRFVPKEKSNA
jgi:hypothetical protein